jgi:polyferredoxin
MELLYRIATDAIVVVHFAYVAFIVLGLLAILVGIARRWRWTRNVAFRSLHLLAILIVVGEALCGITCPLTNWEQSLRALSGDVSYQGDFIATRVHNILFYEAEPWVFTFCYSLFALVVLTTFILAPPHITRRRSREGS